MFGYVHFYCSTHPLTTPPFPPLSLSLLPSQSISLSLLPSLSLYPLTVPPFLSLPLLPSLPLLFPTAYFLSLHFFFYQIVHIIFFPFHSFLFYYFTRILPTPLPLLLLLCLPFLHRLYFFSLVFVFKSLAMIAVWW